MNLLAAKLYDPSTAVSKSTATLLAMTAFDTTNLRLTFTIPAHGMVRVIMGCTFSGAITMPQIILGVLEGSTVRGRCIPIVTVGGTALATTNCDCYAEFIITGLTPGSVNWDAAYGVETVVASTNIHYGGPNNATANDAWGGFSFEIWDPQPLQVSSAALQIDSSGRVDIGKVAGTTQTAGDLKASINTLQTDTDDIQTRLPSALVSGRIDASVGAMAANVMTAAAAASDLTTELQSGLATSAALATVQADTDDIQSRLPAALISGKMDSNAQVVGDKTGYALSAAAIDSIWDEVIEGANTIRGYLRGFASAMFGKSNSHQLSTPKYRDVADTKDRISATTDANGNRTSVTIDLS